MKQTLQTFFDKTAHSLNASEYLLRFNRIPPDQFLLIIPTNQNSFQTFISEIEYLLKLELSPSIFLSPHFISIKSINTLETTLKELKIKYSSPLFLIYQSSESFLEDLIRIAKKKNFYKYIFTHTPLRNDRQQVANLVHLNNCKSKWDKASTKVLEWATPLLQALGPTHSLQITEAENILPELFTHKGAGTFLSLGYQFSMLSEDELDTTLFLNLIENGFQKELKPNYLSSLGANPKFLIEKNYNGIIVFFQHENFYYLDKVVVNPEYFGRGLGSLLLDELIEQIQRISENHPKLIWRATLDNPYLAKYASLLHQASIGAPFYCRTISNGEYIFHLLGLTDEESKRAVKFMIQHPSSFVQ